MTKKQKFCIDLEDMNVDNQQSNLSVIDKNVLKAFAKGALKHEIYTNETTWKTEDQQALPNYNLRLRLNKYQIGLLKYVAKLERRSMNNLIKKILFSELEKYLK
jgi:hypothetical protein